MNDELKKRKGIYLLLAILVAVAFWIYVDEFGDGGNPREIESTLTDIPITYIGEEGLADRGLMLLPDEQTSATLDLTLFGPRRQVANLGRDDLRVTVNLNSVDRAGIQSLTPTITSTDRHFSRDMVAPQSPSIVTVNIKELNSKAVEIRCELVGNLAEGCSAGELILSQAMLELRGQEEDIGPVAYAKVTLDIGDNANESVTRKLEFTYYDLHDQVVTNPNIRATVETVQVTLPVYVTKELSLSVDFKEADGLKKSNLNYEIKPSTIAVSGDASVLNHVDTIVLGEFDLFDLLDSGASSHTYPIIIPEGCQNLSGVTRATLETEFKDVAKQQVATSRFSHKNLPVGKQVDILTQELSVTIFGTTADVAAVTGEKIVAEVDLSNYAGASGTYTVPAAITVETDGDIGVSGTYQVQVTIREQTPEQPETELDAPEEP